MKNYLLVALLFFSFLRSSKPANAFNPTLMNAFLTVAELPVEQHEPKPDCTQSAVKNKARFVKEFDEVILPFWIGAFAVAFVPYLIYYELRPYMKHVLGHMNPMPAPHALPPFVPNDALRNSATCGG